MYKNKSCDGSKRAVIITMGNDGKYFGAIMKSLNMSKRMVFNIVQYFNKNKTTKELPRKQKA